MPYRRLPNTDQARLYALQTAVQRAREADFTEQVLNYQTLTQAQRFLMGFESQVAQYHQKWQDTVMANKKFRHVVGNARMYISHFIQVLNMAVQRGEIKAEKKELYKLDPEHHIVPDLSSEEDLLVWGQNIIDGEFERQKQGGQPINYPTIAKVKVFYDIFKDMQKENHLERKAKEIAIGGLEPMRVEADAIILDVWNQVEEYYKNCLPYERLRACQNYGVIYYYRNGEERLTPETDKKIQDMIARSPQIPFGD